MRLSAGYKRFMAVGCSHGALVDPHAIAAVLKFKKHFKPHRTFHLGDVNDFAAFRGGAGGTKDEAEAIGPDIAAGSDFIQRLEPTDVLIGNHDERVWKLSEHPNAVIAHAAACSRNEFLTACNKVRARVLDHYDVNRSWIELGDYKLMHGWFYSVDALKQHCEHFGNVIIAHLHAPGVERGRRSDNPMAYCTGMLADRDRLTYAHERRATARWGLGFVYGEYSADKCYPNLAQWACGDARNWRLPI